MPQWMTRLRKLFGSAAVSRPGEPPQAGQPDPGSPRESFFERLLPGALATGGLGDEQRSVVLQCFATDTCERLLLLEKHARRNEDAECFRLLGVVRRQIAEGTRRARALELEEQLRQRARSLSDEDERGILLGGVFQLAAEDPEDMADRAFTHTMLRLVRHGGPFVDMVRARERAWHEARLTWWITRGVHLPDMYLTYSDEVSAGVPEDASVHHGIRMSDR